MESTPESGALGEGSGQLGEQRAQSSQPHLPLSYGQRANGSATSGQTPASQGFSFLAMQQRWQAVLTKPRVATFDAQQAGANWRTLLISLGILAVVSAASHLVWGFELHDTTRDPSAYGDLIQAIMTPLGGAAYALVGEFIAFFAFSGILYVSARCLGARGSFLTQSWLLSLASVPIGIVGSVTSIIPAVGSIVALPLGVYSIVLTVLALASAHHLRPKRAFAVLLAPLAVLVWCAGCALAVSVAIYVSTHPGSQ